MLGWDQRLRLQEDYRRPRAWVGSEASTTFWRFEIAPRAILCDSQRHLSVSRPRGRSESDSVRLAKAF